MTGFQAEIVSYRLKIAKSRCSTKRNNINVVVQFALVQAEILEDRNIPACGSRVSTKNGDQITDLEADPVVQCLSRRILP